MTAIIGLFQEFAAQFAESSRAMKEKYFSIGGFGVRLRLDTGGWAGALTSALDHLRVIRPPESGKQLTISILDGTVAPRNPLLRLYLRTLAEQWTEYTGMRGQLTNIHGGSVVAFYHPGPDILSVVDLESDVAFIWKRDLAPLPYYEAGSPMRGLLHAWMSRQGVQFVHAGAVGTESGGVLLAGKGGSGKSTSVLACLDSGLKYASDDYCMAGPSDSEHWDVFSLYNTAKLVGDSDLAKFAHLDEYVWNRHRKPDDKIVIFLNQAFPQKVICRFPLKALLLPSITGGTKTTIEPCSGGAALMSLGPSSMAQLPVSGPGDLSRIAKLVHATPCFRLKLGTDLAQIPQAIGNLLADLN